MPKTRAEVGAYDAALVKRITTLLDSPAHWNHSGSGTCLPDAQSFSLICALQVTIAAAAAEQRTGRGPEPSDCRFQRTSVGIEGSCGPLFDKLPLFAISRVPGVATGRWRDDASATEVWRGVMTDAAAPVLMEARRTVDVVTTKKYSARLVGFNNDTATTFADIRRFLDMLAERVSSRAAADIATEGDTVEVEIYAGGAGVIRTYEGWFPVAHFSSTGDEVHFRMDTTKQVPPNMVDRRILLRAAAILDADSVWNRSDDRRCAESARTWSIYCAVQKATIEVAGAFHHRRPAAELVRQIVEERTKDRSYEHRLMDYNNDPSTTVSDVRTLFAEALARIP